MHSYEIKPGVKMIQSHLHILEWNSEMNIHCAAMKTMWTIMVLNSDFFASLSVKNQSNIVVACPPRNACGWWARLVDCLKSKVVDSEDANCFSSSIGTQCDCN
jgi:hypothetical protein